MTGVMALPPVEAGGESHQFLGGSNVGISANSSQQELAKKAMKLILSEDFMSQLAEDSGWVPGNTEFASSIPDGIVDAQPAAADRRDERTDPGRTQLGDRRGQQHPRRSVLGDRQG
ncbi:hypothetical protein ACU8V6_00395 [Vibrio alginolyticus]